MSPTLPPEIEKLFSDADVTDICINDDGLVFYDSGQGMAKLEFNFTRPWLKDWVLLKMSILGKSWDAKDPFLDGTLPEGFRFHAVFPPVAQPGPIVSLRRLTPPLRRRFWSEAPGFKRLRTLVNEGHSILVSGATGSGKTTLISELLSEIPHYERIVALEETPELKPDHPHFLSLQSRPSNADGFGEISFRKLLKQTLRMRPDRIVLGECRGAEVLDLLQILNTGHKGALGTLHASSAREAVKRLELLCQLSGPLSLRAIRELISLGLQWVVHVERQVERHSDSSRKIVGAIKIEGMEGDTLLVRPMLDFFIE